MEVEDFFAHKLPQALPVVQKLKMEDPCGCTTRLKDEEIRSIYFYTTEHEDYSYTKINYLLDQGNIASSELRHQIAKIDSGLHALAPYLGACLRGEDLNGFIHKKAQELLQRQPRTAAEATNIEYLCSGFFMSSTLNLSSNMLKRDVKIVILSKGGARDVSHLSAFPEEKEVLFARDARFVVTEVEQIDKNYIINLLEV